MNQRSRCRSKAFPRHLYPHRCRAVCRRLSYLVMLALFFSSVAADSLWARTRKIDFWHILGYHTRTVIDQMVEEYNRSSDSVQVSSDFQGFFEEAQVKLLAAAVSGSLPEVAMVPAQFLQVYIENGLIEPIDQELPVELIEDIPSRIWKLAARGDHTYGIPFCVFTDIFLYNRNAFEEAGLDPDRPPDNWEELVETGGRLTRDQDGDGDTDAYALTFYTDGMYGITPILRANGGNWFDGSQVNLDTPPMLKTLDMVRDLVFTHGIMPRDWTGFESAQAFLTGDLAMGWFISPGISYSREYLPWELGISHIPRFNGERHALLYGTVLVNFARGRKNRRRAMDFMLGLVSRENDIRMFEQVGFVPVRESSRSSLQVRAFVKNNPVFGVPIEALEYARALPPHPRFQKIDREIAAMLERIILGGASPSGELARTQAILDEIVGGD